MKNKQKKYQNWNVAPSTILSFRYSFIALLITLILMAIIPKVLNYGPESINTAFDIKMSGIPYTTQFLLIILAITLAIIILTKLLLKDIDKWFKGCSNNSAEITNIRKKCLRLPYIFFGIEFLLPTIATIAILSLTGSHHIIMKLKITLLLFTFSSFLAILSFLFSQNLYEQILAETYDEKKELETGINLKEKLFLIIFIVILASIAFTALVGYSSSIKDKANSMYISYSREFNRIFDINKTYTLEEIKALLNTNIKLSENESFFILSPSGEVIYSQEDLSKFVIEYTTTLSEKYNGRIYDSYGVDTQGYCFKLKIETGYYYVGVLYDIYSNITLLYLINTLIALVIITSVIVLILVNSLSKNLSQISNGFESIINQTHTASILPVGTPDEIGDLVVAFNKIQKLNKNQIDTIQNNQNTLIERERLASLGQMVGGIAHNLKTPIFSISGGLEGLSDLIKEYDESIEDPNVTDQDMHDIAKDMREWITKLKEHTSYMSDVITAVKGQAVNLSEEQSIDFTIEELFQHIKILMQHEVKHSLSTLNITNNVDNVHQINGSINSLVQVINNLISNAIQSYENTQKDKIIDLTAEYDNTSHSIIISVRDYGPGLPDNVKQKLFKEMITTKGKDGTGLGLFMSYSNIKAHFKGDLTFETENNKGTTFFIKIPI